MEAKTKKILLWSGIGLGAVGLGVAIYYAIKNSSVPPEEFKNGDQKDTSNKSGDGPKNALPLQDTETGNTASVLGINMGAEGGWCGSIKTTFDGDFDYVRCISAAKYTLVANKPIWYTKSKLTSSRGIIYKDWTSLANNTLATQKLNAKYPNG